MKTFKNSIDMEFVLLPSGAFRMGLLRQEEPIHTVKLSAFWMGKFEVTNVQFERFKPRSRPVESRSDNQPATRLMWEDAVHFCQWLSKKEGKRYRLPTEAEWEYAARGGLDQKEFPWGDDIEWVGRATFGVSKTTPVGSHPPNGFDLYDVTGNVAEFVSDWYDENYYQHSPPLNPKGPDAPP